MNKQVFKFIIIAIFFFIAVNSSAQIHDFDSLVEHSQEFKKRIKAIGDTLDFFNSNEILHLTFESDFKNLVKRKYKDEYQPATIRVVFNDTIMLSRKLKIKPRGNMRKSTCHIPPIKLNFPKKDVFIKQLNEFDKMKMVLNCKKGDAYTQYLISEYYTYKIQNILTKYSLRVRLVSVKYIDTSDKYKDVTQYAILLENIDQLAKRLGAIHIETKNVRDQLTDIKTLADAYLFQYLIGNTDWSIPGMHNIYLLKSMEMSKPKPYVVPYDFDYAGIINTTYAVPDEQLGLESVRERVYRGVCLPEAEIIEAKERVLQNKEKIYQLIQKDQLMSKNNKKNTVSYIDDFFHVLESEYSFSRNILQNCRQ